MLIECNHKWDYPSVGYAVLDCNPGATANYQRGRGIYGIQAEPLEVEDWPLEVLN